MTKVVTVKDALPRLAVNIAGKKKGSLMNLVVAQPFNQRAYLYTKVYDFGYAIEAQNHQLRRSEITLPRALRRLPGNDASWSAILTEMNGYVRAADSASMKDTHGTVAARNETSTFYPSATASSLQCAGGCALILYLRFVVTILASRSKVGSLAIQRTG